MRADGRRPAGRASMAARGGRWWSRQSSGKSWRPATRDWPEAYAILTIQANDDIALYHDRQMVVLRRDERSAWLDMTHPEQEVLRPLPGRSFAISRLRQGRRQAEFAI